MGEWQPIKTANKKQFEVVLLSRRGDRESMPCFWDGKRWKCASIFGDGLIYVRPTHWMQLPEPPK